MQNLYLTQIIYPRRYFSICFQPAGSISKYVRPYIIFIPNVISVILLYRTRTFYFSFVEFFNEIFYRYHEKKI